MPNEKTASTRARIVEAARGLAGERGPAAVSFDAVAARLGLSKQAVIYWFPSKALLMRELVLPALAAEAEAAVAALAGATARGEAVARFVRAVAGFHLADLDRFRMMYLLPQTGPRPRKADLRAVLEAVHPVTARMYGALAGFLPGGADGPAARRMAVAVHGSVLGLVLMVALAERSDDPLRHGTDDLVDSLAAVLAGPGV
ncbi:TetR/AcrR family transcriptional regulator [Aquibium sp. A9E412]|uniref:TetR/AcrR family transcriptional regulator n=1 Tax=Aquibium sp. A9E412 TaxID=2976767 RepID=UPI0025B2313B|nr:TetR/AcrR family transcriptional regulator [Aquibium sp. A9E412]MDN2564941.1 TetR/AcrR family transcriptional regulator [Aquibium sp. A9E412]